jgi:hypothetical protein
MCTYQAYRLSDLHRRGRIWNTRRHQQRTTYESYKQSEILEPRYALLILHNFWMITQIWDRKLKRKKRDWRARSKWQLFKTTFIHVHRTYWSVMNMVQPWKPDSWIKVIKYRSQINHSHCKLLKFQYYSSKVHSTWKGVGLPLLNRLSTTSIVMKMRAYRSERQVKNVESMSTISSWRFQENTHHF